MKENIADSPDKAEDIQEVVSIVEELRNAIVYYQVNHAARMSVERVERIPRERLIYNQIYNLTVRLLIDSSSPELTKHPVLQVLPRRAPETARGSEIIRNYRMVV